VRNGRQRQQGNYLVGNLGADPEIRRLNSGDPVVNIRIATSESWRDKNSGERKEKTEWHNVVIFNENIAKVAEQYLKKGMKVYVEGQLQTRKWQDQDGVQRPLHHRNHPAEVPWASFRCSSLVGRATAIAVMIAAAAARRAGQTIAVGAPMTSAEVASAIVAAGRAAATDRAVSLMTKFLFSGKVTLPCRRKSQAPYQPRRWTTRRHRRHLSGPPSNMTPTARPASNV
jgi:hypothetical protein